MQQLVRQYQDELLRTAYLLTGVTNSAVTLAATAFLDLFKALPRSATDRDARLWLLTLTGRAYITGRLASEDLAVSMPPEPSQLPDLLSGGGPQHFHVDDERSRVLAALERLDRRTRVALVLIEFNGLDDSAIARTTGQLPSEMRSELQRARDSVAEAAGRGTRQLRGPLSYVATSAPRNDLWERISEPLERIEEHNRRRNRQLIGGAVALACLVLTAGLVWLVAADAFDEQQPDSSSSGAIPAVTIANTPEVTPTEELNEADGMTTLASPDPSGLSSFTIGIGEMPDLQMIAATSYDPDRGNNSITSVTLSDQSTGISEQLGDVGFLGGVSPDGRWLLFTQLVWNEDAFDGQMAITAYDTHNKTIAWQKQYELNLGFNRFGAAVAMAVTPEQVYISGYDGYIVALNLPTGLETGRWSLFPQESDTFADAEEGNSPVNRSVRLYVAPNQRRLYAFIETYFTDTVNWARTTKVFNLPGMVEASSQTRMMRFEHNDRWEIDFEFWNALPTFDGSSFYTVMTQQPEGFIVRFLDLRSNELTDIELPFAAGPSPTFPTMVQSNSGRWLYLFHGDTPQVAIVDLLNRRLDRTFPLDGNGFQLSALPAYGAGELELSQDGERLYLTTWNEVNEQRVAPETIVLVVDVRTWQVIDRWRVQGHVSQMNVHPDGEQLSVLLVQSYPLTPPDQSEYYLLTLDNDGNQVGESVRMDTLVPDETIAYPYLYSFSDGYKRQFGLAPVVGGVPPADAALISTLPGVEIAAGQEEVAAGNAAEITVRFTDPSSGEVLSSARPDVRLDLDAGVSISLSHSDADPVIVQPVQLEDGSYRAVVFLEQPGLWSATVNLTYGDGTQWSTTTHDVVTIIQSFVASDGKRYAPIFTTEPEAPAADESMLVRVAFRDITNGLLMPEGVNLPGGLPETIAVSFVNLTHGVTSVTLTETEHGVYEGSDSLPGDGKWSANLRFRLGDQSTSMTGGTVTVGSPADDS